VTAAGEIVDGPDGWTAELDGVTYTVTHNEGARVVPTLTTINSSGIGFVSPQLVDVGLNSFSWQNYRNSQGVDATCATAVRAAVLP
jgi:hypothetical protein